MKIKNERELRCVLFGMTLGHDLSCTRTMVTSQGISFGDFISVDVEFRKNDDGHLTPLKNCDPPMGDLAISGAMRVSKIEARDAWLSMFEHSEENT